MLQSPIFVVGAHKSGTTLVRSLLDSHPDLFVIPIETHFFEHMEYWVSYNLRANYPQSLSKQKLIDTLVTEISWWNSIENPRAGCYVKGRFNIGKLKKYLQDNLNKELKKDNIKSTFIILVRAIYYSIYGCELPDNKRIVEKSVGMSEFALDLQAAFPDSRFLHVIRNPYANLVSLRKFKTRNSRYPWLGYSFRALLSSHYFMYRNIRLLKKYKIIKYENLVTDLHQMIESICDFLDLKYTDLLLSPTNLGEPWLGNSTSNQAMKQVSSSQIYAWSDQITPLELALVNKHLKHVLEDFGYDVRESQKSILRPGPNEQIKQYIANRLFWVMG